MEESIDMGKTGISTGALSKQQSSVESRAIYAALVGGGIGFLVGLLVFWSGDVALFERGRVSLGFVATILGSVTALVTYLVVALREQKARETLWQYIRRTVSVWSLALTHGLLAFLLYALVFYVVSQSFIGAHIDTGSAATLTALSTGLAAYVVYLSAATMTAMRVSMLLALFLVSGTFLSMLTASNPFWWDDHFSSLGAGGGVSGYAFNATLIIAGLVIVALSKYIADDFKKLQQDGRVSERVKVRAVQTILAGIGLALAGVGLFVYNEFPTIHNTAAAGMAVLFLGIVAVLPWVTPGFTKAFFVASYGLLVSLLVSVWLFLGIGYFNLTVFELVAAAIIFVWLVLFVRHTAALLGDMVIARNVKKGVEE